METYSDATRKEAYRLRAEGLSVGQISKKLKIPLHTIYHWTSSQGRAKYASLLSDIQTLKEASPRRGRPPKAFVAALEPAQGEAGESELERLRRENRALKKMIELYREMVGT